MSRSLAFLTLRITLLGWATSVLLFLPFWIWLLQIAMRQYERELFSRVAARVAEELVIHENSPTAEEEVFRTLRIVNPAISPYLLNNNAEIVSPRNSPFLGQRIPLESLPCALDPEAGRSCVAASTAPVFYRGEAHTVYLVVSHGIAHFFSSSAGISWAVTNLLPGLAMGFALVLIIGGILAWYVTRELRRLAAVVSSYAAGDFRPRLFLKGGDEIAHLGSTTDSLAATIELTTKQRQETKTERGHLFSSLIHDLRRPLSVLSLLFQRMERNSSQQSSEQVVDTAIDAIHSEKMLLSEILTLEGKGESERRDDLSLFQVVFACCTQLSPTFQKKGVDFQFPQVEVPGEIRGNREEIFRVVLNLLDNALNYTPSGGRVECQLSAQDGLLRLEVTDSGIGIPPEEQQKIFEPYYRSPSARSVNPNGSGIGLSTVRRLVRRHGGNLTLRSAVGQGTRFSCVFPTQDNILIEAGAEAEEKPNENFLQFDAGESAKSNKSRSITREALLLGFFGLEAILLFLIFPPPPNDALPAFLTAPLCSLLLAVLLLAAIRFHSVFTFLFLGLFSLAGFCFLPKGVGDISITYFGICGFLTFGPLPKKGSKFRSLPFVFGMLLPSCLLLSGRQRTWDLGIYFVAVIAGYLVRREVCSENQRPLFARLSLVLYLIVSGTVIFQGVLLGAWQQRIFFGGSAVLSLDYADSLAAFFEKDRLQRTNAEIPIPEAREETAFLLGWLNPRLSFLLFCKDNHICARSPFFERTRAELEEMYKVVPPEDRGLFYGENFVNAVVSVPGDPQTRLLIHAESGASEFVLRKSGEYYLTCFILFSQIIVILVCLLCGRLLKQRVSNRVDQLSRFVEELKTGRAMSRSDEISGDEIDTIRSLLGELSARLEKAREELTHEDQKTEVLLRGTREFLSEELDRLESELSHARSKETTQFPLSQFQSLTTSQEAFLQNVFDMIRLEAGKVELQKSRFDIADLIDDACLSFLSGMPRDKAPQIARGVLDGKIAAGDLQLLTRATMSVLEILTEIKDVSSKIHIESKSQDSGLVLEFTLERVSAEGEQLGSASEVRKIFVEEVAKAHGWTSAVQKGAVRFAIPNPQ